MPRIGTTEGRIPPGKPRLHSVMLGEQAIAGEASNFASSNGADIIPLLLFLNQFMKFRM